jgi:DNA-binding NarL/FixJ family response regulator
MVLKVQIVSGNAFAADHLIGILARDPEDDPKIHAVHARDIQAAIDAAPDIFLIDTTDAPARRPEVLVKILRSRRKETKLVVIVPNTTHDAEEPATKLFMLITAGVAGLLREENVPTQLARALRGVHGGNYYFPTDLLAIRSQLDRVLNTPRILEEPLTPREQTILPLVERRLSNSEIALVLGLSQNSVKSSVSSIMSKRGVTSRRELSASLRVPNSYLR